MVRQHTRQLVYASLFLAVAVLLSFVSIYFGPTLKVSLAPVIVIFAGASLGPTMGALVGGLSDVLVLLIKSLPGAYFPGFTITMALYGILGGLLLRSREGRKPSIMHITTGTIVIQCICSLFVNTGWLVMLTGSPYGVLMVSRMPLTFINAGFYLLILIFLFRYQEKWFKAPQPNG